MESGQEATGAGEVDLFGHPKLAIRDRRGRPSFAKTKENQQFVAARAAANWSHERIAADMGIHADTLRKHFSAELQNGRIYIEGMIVDVLVHRAREGHVPSIRLLKEMIDPHPERAAKAPGADRGKAAPVGLKEKRKAEAQQPTQGWGDILAPVKPVN